MTDVLPVPILKFIVTQSVTSTYRCWPAFFPQMTEEINDDYDIALLLDRRGDGGKLFLEGCVIEEGNFCR